MRVAVVGGGQVALSVGHYLRRAGLAAPEDYVLFDSGRTAGGAWIHAGSLVANPMFELPTSSGATKDGLRKPCGSPR